MPPMADFERIVQLYWRRIFRFALASLRDHDAAQTIAQDCLLKAHLHMQSYREEGSMQAWLMSIAANLIRDHRRNKQSRFWRSVEPVLELSKSSTQTAEDVCSLSQQAKMIWNAARQLPKRQRTLLYYRYFFEMNVAELAAATGLTEGSVKTHLFRAIRKIRRILKEE